MGGAEPILAKSEGLLEAGDYLLATEILNKLVYAEPGNTAAKQLLADAFEQIGYQQESPSVRNSFLAAALEAPAPASRGCSTEEFTPGHDPCPEHGPLLDFSASGCARRPSSERRSPSTWQPPTPARPSSWNSAMGR